MFSRDQSGYSIVTETTNPAQVQSDLSSQLTQMIRQWSAERPNPYQVIFLSGRVSANLHPSIGISYTVY
jgi:hypothetical protein